MTPGFKSGVFLRSESLCNKAVDKMRPAYRMRPVYFRIAAGDRISEKRIKKNVKFSEQEFDPHSHTHAAQSYDVLPTI